MTDYQPKTLDEKYLTKVDFFAAMEAHSKRITKLDEKMEEFDEKITPMVEVFKEAGFLLKLIKMLVIASTAILVLWGLIKQTLSK